MPKACSADLRERVLAAVEEGAARREAAERFEVSPSSAVKWFQAWEREGRRTAKPAAGADRRWRTTRTRSWLWSASIRTGRWRNSSRPCTGAGFPAAAARCGGFSSATASATKKTLRAAEQDRADVARARRHWIRQQALLDTSCLVFIDETSVTTAMARLYGRCLRGERLLGCVPFGTWQTLTFVAALRRDELTAPLVIEGAMNGDIFRSYVEQCLAPTLSRGDIVVLDNLRAHMVAGVREVIEAAGAQLRYLPKSSPDLNPIEMAFSKLKAHLRKAAERTQRGLRRRIGRFVPRLKPHECANYFAHAGYISI